MSETRRSSGMADFTAMMLENCGPGRRLGTDTCMVLATLFALPSCSGDPAAGIVAPIIAGLEQPGLSSRVRGLVLLGELGCAACHREEAGATQVDRRVGPDLATVGRRLRPEYIARFLGDPLHTEPGTAMPDLLRGGEQVDRDADALARYLQSFSQPVAGTPAHDWDASARGRELFHDVGCAACHAPRDEAGNERALANSVPLGTLGAKYSIVSLREFLLAPHRARPARRMPDLRLTPSEAHYLATYLIPSVTPPSAPAPDDTVIALGRARFAVLGCAQCHELPDPQRGPPPSPTPLAQLDPERGCLSGALGSWPFYALNDRQRRDLRVALGALAQPIGDEAVLQQHLTTRNCTACHVREELGGFDEERDELFATDNPGLGQEGRVPPTLTGVGSKLQREWLVDAIAHGQSIRPALRTRMPGFGVDYATKLAELLARADELPEIAIQPLPGDEEARQAVLDLGRELVGSRGLDCITCHLWAGQEVGTMAAVDLVDSTGQRLRPQWFAHFLRNPYAFKPITLMPQFFPDGATTRPELGDGDVARQIDAMWHYLGEGRNVRRPSGVQRPRIELEVTDETVILRRNVENTGKRGISVGHPGGVNFTFDAERLALNQIWWGKFIDAAPVWTGQGSGEARILGERRATLPHGPAFTMLSDVDAPWPTATRRELEQQWSGYDLDAEQRPTFRYVCYGVTVSDKPVARVIGNDGDLALTRTIEFQSQQARTLHFRAALAARVEDLGDGSVRAGKSLVVRPRPPIFRIRQSGEQLELVLDIAITAGRSSIEIDYLWREEGK